MMMNEISIIMLKDMVGFFKDLITKIIRQNL